MYVKRGNYTHDNNEAHFRFSKEAVFADNNALIGTKYRVKITGVKTGTDASDLSTKMLAMEAAYALVTGDFYVLQNDGSTAVDVYTILGSKTIGGIRCTRFDYALAQPAELTTYVRYEIDLEADAGGVGIIGGGTVGQSTVLTWTEALSFRGDGGPRFVLRELRNGPPQKQLVSQVTPVYATQRGEAVGLYGYPTASQPLWPQHLLRPESEVTKTGATQIGGSGNQQQRREFRISWSYQFMSSGPLTASPNTGY